MINCCMKKARSLSVGWSSVLQKLLLNWDWSPWPLPEMQFGLPCSRACAGHVPGHARADTDLDPDPQPDFPSGAQTCLVTSGFVWLPLSCIWPSLLSPDLMRSLTYWLDFMACLQTCNTYGFSWWWGLQAVPSSTGPALLNMVLCLAPSSLSLREQLGLATPWQPLYPIFLLFPSPINCLRKVRLMNSGMAYWQVEIKPHRCSPRLIRQILVVERLIALWLVMSYSASLRRHVIYFYRLSHELPVNGFLNLEFSMARVSNSNEQGAFATLLGHPGNCSFHIF